MTSIPPDADPPLTAAGPSAEPLSQQQLREMLDQAHSDIGIHPASLPPAPKYPRRRRIRLPLLLFLLTCISTYAAGCYQWFPTIFGSPWQIEVATGDTYIDHEGKTVTAQQAGVVIANWQSVVRYNWRDGVIYMVCVLSALLLHEMGHFLVALRHRVPASFPFFIPVPFMITGTMGAVIGMDPYKANRREVFDIGIAGPLAGLVLIVPLVIYGIMIAEPVPELPEPRGYGDPLLVKLLMPVVRDMEQIKQDYAREHDQPDAVNQKFTFQVNAIYMAGWVGMLVTGLNMMPVSQLDGGHVLYGLFGPASRYLARVILVAIIAAIVLFDAYQWTLMLILVVMIGDHPRTADDSVKLGPLRWLLGFISLSIPIFCFPPFPIQF
jgi:membrane-associated protease RseP (regulator of RpoE activity)